MMQADVHLKYRHRWNGILSLQAVGEHSNRKESKMKVILIIYLVVSICAFVFVYLTAFYARSIMKKRYPNTKYRKDGLLKKFIDFIRILFISFCPILNLVSLIIWIVGFDEVVENAIEKVYNEYAIKEDE